MPGGPPEREALQGERVAMHPGRREDDRRPGRIVLTVRTSGT